MDSVLSGIFLAATTLIYVVVAALASRGVATKENYLLGNRSFKVPSITMTLVATQLGAGMIFGTALESYHYGFYGLAYICGMALGLIILSLGVGARLRSLNISTTAELFESKYGSKKLRKLAALISIFTMGGILAAQIVASRQLFATLFDLNPLWLVAFWLIIITYTMFGGIKAVIATDILQVILIVAVFSVVLFLVIPLADMKALIASPAASSPPPLLSNSLFATLLCPVLFSLIEQDLAQRFFASKNQRVATISAFLAAIFLLIFALVPTLLGMYAKNSGIELSAGHSPLVLLLQGKLSSFGMTAVACALLAAICSTADSLLGAASTNLIADFASEEKKYSLIVSRLITFITGILALIVAFYYDNVIAIIVKSYEISISALFVPMIIAMYSQKPSRIGALFSVTLGISTFVIGSQIELPFSATFFALVISTLGFALGAQWERLQRKA